MDTWTDTQTHGNTDRQAHPSIPLKMLVLWGYNNCSIISEHLDDTIQRDIIKDLKRNAFKLHPLPTSKCTTHMQFNP